MPPNRTYASLEQRISERNRRRRERYAAAKVKQNAETSVGICTIALTGIHVHRSGVSVDIESPICGQSQKVGSVVSPAPACFGHQLDQNGFRNNGIEGSDTSQMDVMTCGRQRLAGADILEVEHALFHLRS